MYGMMIITKHYSQLVTNENSKPFMPDEKDNTNNDDVVSVLPSTPLFGRRAPRAMAVIENQSVPLLLTQEPVPLRKLQRRLGRGIPLTFVFVEILAFLFWKFYGSLTLLHFPTGRANDAQNVSVDTARGNDNYQQKKMIM